MKHTKRIFALLLALCLLLGLAACAGQAAPAKEDNSAAPEKPATVAPDAGREAKGEAEIALDGGEYGFYGDPGVSFYAKDDGLSTGTSGAGVPEGGGEAGLGEGRIDSGEPIAIDDPIPGETVPAVEPDPARGLVLTAAEWNDNENWPFFSNLVNTGTISFPAFGLDPRNRVEVRVSDEAGAPLVNETVTLVDAAGKTLWTARSNKEGVAYLFWAGEESPDRAVCGGAEAPVQVPAQSGDPQSETRMQPLDSISLTVSAQAPAQSGLQVMFIVDTTGSMSDEIAYLQKDFSAIAERVGGQDVEWAVSFYRDEGDDYVTRHSPFSADVAELQARINAEYAAGGGDEPEAVAQVLTECLTQREDWNDSAAKLAFLIFDAPPHEGREAELRAAVKAAAEKGVRVIPVVASNAARETELFGRALAILTDGSYVFLTDDSGVGGSHLEPIVGDYQVELLQDLIVKIIQRYR